MRKNGVGLPVSASTRGNAALGTIRVVPFVHSRNRKRTCSMSEKRRMAHRVKKMSMKRSASFVSFKAPTPYARHHPSDACYWRHDSEKEVKTYMEVLDCPGKHGVQRVKSFPKRGYQCDVCATEILMYSAVHSCRQCHYDVCSRCATGARSIRLRTDDPGICPEVTEDSADSENG